MTTLYDLTALMECADAACNDAFYNNVHFGLQGWCVNWGDLSCVSAEKYENEKGQTGYRVYIEEADCDKLKVHVRDYLRQRGFEDIDVMTEW